MESSRNGLTIDPKELEVRYRAFFEQSVWAFSQDVERIIRPYSTSDFKREYFIPDL